MSLHSQQCLAWVGYLSPNLLSLCVQMIPNLVFQQLLPLPLRGYCEYQLYDPLTFVLFCPLESSDTVALSLRYEGTKV